MHELLHKCDSDLIRVTWAHGVNSIQALSDVIKSDINCIETDIVYCHEDGLLYNAHPPAYRSDSLFTEYWNIARESSKIFKLDFKMLEAIEPCLKLIDGEDFSCIIINADILKSSSSNMNSVPYDEFLNLCWKYLPRAHLSIGWTTIRESTIGYTWTDVYEMNMIISKIRIHGIDTDQIITIPVDAHMLSLNSLPKFVWLLDQNPGCRLSITIWSYKNVSIDIQSLKAIRKMLKKSSIFIDLPELSDHDRDQISAVTPNSDPSSLRMDTRLVHGNHFWPSRTACVIGNDTIVEMTIPISEKLEFFIAFNSLPDIDMSSGHSECSVLVGSRANVLDTVQISFKEESGVVIYTLTPDGSKEESRWKKSRENVYYVSLEYDRIRFGIVEHYNTSRIECEFVSALSVTAEPTVKLTVNTLHSDGRLTVVDFVDYSLLPNIIFS